MIETIETKSDATWTEVTWDKMTKTREAALEFIEKYKEAFERLRDK